MERTEKRYYKVGERVWVRDKKILGIIKKLNIKPEKSIFKAYIETVEKKDNLTNVQTTWYDLWEIDKDKRTLFKDQRKSQPTILTAKIRETAKLPSKSVEDAGYDLYADFAENYMFLRPQTVTMIPTGIATSLTDDWVLIVKERGSTAKKGMAVRAGVVDSGYRGEIFVALNNTTSKEIVIAKEHIDVSYFDENTLVYPYEKAIAQMLLVPVPKANVKEISYDELSKIPSQRGVGKLGSSGK